MSNPYLVIDDVGTLPGELQALWQILPPTVQQSWVDKANDRVDQILEIPGGILAQTNLFWRINQDRDTDVLFLPHKPVTQITSIFVIPQETDPYTLPVVSAQPGVPGNIYLSGGSSFRYKMSTNYIPQFDRGFHPFQEDDMIEVTYNAGYAVVPNLVKDAARILLGVALMDEANNPGGALSISESGTHIMYGRTSVVNNMTMDAEALLDTYRIQAPL